MKSQNTPHFIPSSSLLMDMIKAAETKFDAARRREMNEWAERARRINQTKIQAERESNQRRYVYCGAKP
jgi:hypothetical protein